MELSKKRWIILASSCFINLCIGSLYSWSVFASPMEAYFNNVIGLSVSSGGLAIVFTVANSVGPVTMIFGGKINDRLGPRWVIFTGGILFGAGMVISGFVTSVSGLIFSYGILCGLGMGTVYGCTIGNAIKFFPDKRGLAGGIATASYGISSVIIPPIANAIITTAGVTEAFKILGIVFLVIICLGSFFIEKCPENFIPKGWHLHADLTAETVYTEGKDWKEMIYTSRFYIMILILTCGAFSGLMCISQASPIAQEKVGMTVSVATATVSILALFNAAGRVTAGYISDKIGRINTLALAFLFSILGLGLIYISEKGDIVTFCIGISLVGLCFGAFMGVFPGFTADQFGTKNNSVNYGIMFMGFSLAGFFGPTIMRNVYSAEGSYGRAFLVAASFGLVGLILTFLFRTIQQIKINSLKVYTQSADKRP